MQLYSHLGKAGVCLWNIIIVLCFFVDFLFLMDEAAGQPFTHTIVVTDITGFKDTLAEMSEDKVKIVWSDSHRDQPSNYLEVLFNGSPSRLAGIHHSQILRAIFSSFSGNVLISVTLSNGDSLSGMFPDPDMIIQAKTDLGEQSLPIRNVSSIEFLLFTDFQDDKRVMMDQKCAAIHWRQRQPSPFTRVRDMEERWWTILDGKIKKRVQGLEILDSYDTNRESILKTWIGRWFRDRDYLYELRVRRGASEFEIPIEYIQSIELTGKLLGEGPELKLTKTDGSEFTVEWLLKKRSWNGNPEFGKSDHNDMLSWKTEWGYEAISLDPLRRIMLIADSK